MIGLAGLWLSHPALGAEGSARPERPVRLIFDTDMGNDIDDALALGVIHALQSRGECQLLAVTSSKDNEWSAPYIDLVNTFYGRGDIPVGAVRDGKEREPGKYIQPPCVAMDGGKPRYPRKLQSGKDAPEAVGLLRKVLAAQPDGSVVIAVVGFSTNVARLLDSKPDDASPLPGKELVAKKCRLLSIMAGSFRLGKLHKEYNVVKDLPAATKVFAEWPTPIATSGFEIGLAIKYPAVSIQRDYAYVKHHPLREGYELYMKMPYDRPTWDLTSVLYAVRPDRAYFGLSEPGKIRVTEEGYMQFTPTTGGKDRYLTVNHDQITRVREALVMLSSQPPDDVRLRGQ
ncbi:MAG: nucleoside hydrolase [Phycisphaerae bacterium]|nr:nucleoside hydrolase [Phycisphaerae bacterium]